MALWDIEETVSGPALAYRVLEEAHAPELLEELKQLGATEDLSRALLQLVRHGGGEVDEQSPSTRSAPAERLGVLLGKRYHLKLKKALWESLVACAPLLVALLQTGTLPATATAVGALLSRVLANLERLTPDEWQAYLAVRVLQERGQSRDAEGVVRFLAKTDPAKIQEIRATLGRLVKNGALKEADSGYECVI